MKIKNISRGVCVAVFAACVGLTSCTHDFVEINTNPNTMNVGELNPYGVFEAMFYTYGKNQIRFCYSYSNEITQLSCCSSSGNYIHRYNIENTVASTIWNAYAQTGANAQHMVELAQKNNDQAAEAVGRTLKVMAMANLVDLFGDIPYSEAFLGKYGLTTPKFDSQQEVYSQMFAELETANDLYAESPKFGKPSIDLMYEGDMSKWRKFNNSLYLRLLMRVSARPELGSAEKINEIVTLPSKYPVISSNAESAVIRNTGLDPYINYFDPDKTTSSTFKSRYMTEQVVNLTVYTDLVSEIDPRIYTMYSQGSSDWWGVKSGSTLAELKEDVNDAASLNYNVLCRRAAPVWILNYSEVQFILAEAALKGYIPGAQDEAREYYENAIKAEMKKWGELVTFSSNKLEITDARIETFLSGHLGGWDNASDKYRLVAEQKYLSLFWNGFEAYHELRRTGYPELTIGSGCSYNNYEFPQRLCYPINTVGSNQKNVNDALARMGGEDSMRTPLWWSYKAVNGTFTAKVVEIK